MIFNSAHLALSLVTTEENMKGSLYLLAHAEEHQVCDVTVKTDLPFSFRAKVSQPLLQEAFPLYDAFLLPSGK